MCCFDILKLNLHSLFFFEVNFDLHFLLSLVTGFVTELAVASPCW